MNRACALRVALALASIGAPTAHAAEVLRWQRLPLAVPLIVDQERVILIDRNVRVGVPANAADRLRVQSAGGAVYLRASEPLEPTRLQLQDVDGGTLILLDVTAAPAQDTQLPLEPIRIVDAVSAGANTDRTDTPADDAEPAARLTPVPVVLTRYAAQSLYAPLRTVEPVPGLTQAPLARALALDTLLPTLPVAATPLAAWRLADQWVSAVRLQHTGPGWIELDPRLLQGDFVAATFQHPDLGPAGSPEDTTVVYLVTRGRGLGAALLPAMAPIDPLPHVSASRPAAAASSAREK